LQVPPADAVLRYSYALAMHIMRATACNALHSAEARCCGWLRIVNRSGLERCVCECYAEANRNVRRLLPENERWPAAWDAPVNRDLDRLLGYQLANAHHTAHRNRHGPAQNTEQRSHLCLIQQRAGRKGRRRKEQRHRETYSSDDADDHHASP
jgi:hypothetical protein